MTERRRVVVINGAGGALGAAIAARLAGEPGTDLVLSDISPTGLATKAAVIQLAKVAAVEYSRDRIRVNCVCPGTFRSATHDGLPEESMTAMTARHSLGLGAAADLAGRTPTWRATPLGGRPARRWSSTAATPPPDRASPCSSCRVTEIRPRSQYQLGTCGHHLHSPA